MIRSILIGVIAAAVVFLNQYLSGVIGLIFPAFILWVLCGGIAFLGIYYLIEDRRWQNTSYRGLSSLMIHIIFPSRSDTVVVWLIRGIVSSVLILCGGIVGLEGAATELAQCFCLQTRPDSARWFELKRRTDAAASLAAGISAAFGAPFAGVLLPMELGLGGRGLAIVVSSLAAFLAIRVLGSPFSLSILDPENTISVLSLNRWQEWGSVCIIALVAGVLGIISTLFIGYIEDGFSLLFRNKAKTGKVVSGLLLLLLLFIYNPTWISPWTLLQDLYTLKISWNEGLLLFLTRLLGIALVMAGFGTIGVFFPLFILGNLVGFSVNHWFLGDWIGSPFAAGLVGGTAFLGSTLGVPFSAALLGYELTQNYKVLVICFIASLVSQKLRRLVKARSSLEHELDFQQSSYREGRSVAVMDSLSVKEAMMTDHLEVYEHETVAQLHEKIQISKYPFMAVVSHQGTFRGLLTVDSIEEGWREQKKFSVAQETLAVIIEAKDLLYKNFFKSPIVKVTDCLTATVGIFEQTPCVPVLDDRNKVVGLLFVYSVRLAYDREVARRSYSFMREGKE